MAHNVTKELDRSLGLASVYSIAVGAMPVTAGTDVYVDPSLGPGMGTITGFGAWLSLSAKTSLPLLGLSGYLMTFTDISSKVVSLDILFTMLLHNANG
jgi:hypothetical protein